MLRYTLLARKSLRTHVNRENMDALRHYFNKIQKKARVTVLITYKMNFRQNQ